MKYDCKFKKWPSFIGPRLKPAASEAAWWPAWKVFFLLTGPCSHTKINSYGFLFENKYTEGRI